MPSAIRRPLAARRANVRKALMVAAALPLVVGCSQFSPSTTTRPYAASDGVIAQLGDVRARNLLVVGSAKGATGVVSGALVNTGAQKVTVSVISEGGAAPTSVDVPAGQLVTLGAAGGPGTVLVPSLSAAPGGVVTLALGTAGGGQVQVAVPVLPPTLEYATITPPPTASAGATPSATPSATTPTSTAEPTTSPS